MFENVQSPAFKDLSSITPYQITDLVDVSTHLVFVGKDGSGQLTGAGLVNTSTGGLEKVSINPSKFSEAPTVLLWREVR